MTFYIPQDTTALALGADAVASALQSVGIEPVRSGSRGMFWLEPLLEVETNKGRIGFGPVTAKDIPSIVDALESDPASHTLYQGEVADIPYLKSQQRLTYSRAGLGDPVCLDNYQALNGFKGLNNALQMTGQQIVDQVKDSGLRGRGGAAFPAGIKWQTVHDAGKDGCQKYIVCNADEGDSGTFADRLVMEADPYQLIEGMIIAGLAVGATQGYIYLRSEYPVAHKLLNIAIDRAIAANFLGDNIQGSGKTFYLEVRLGAGAYICGEETSLLESLEGKRGMVRAKPPLPAIEGLFGMPTVVNNVLTLAAISTILEQGADSYQNFGMGRSRGTLAIQLAGNIKRGGLIELAFGVTLREVVEDYGQGTYSGRPIRAIQVGGPLGAFLPESQWDTPMDYEAFAAIKAMIGHGGIVVFDDTADMAAQARFAMEFCVVESCGKCTPCREGTWWLVQILRDLEDGKGSEADLAKLLDLCDNIMGRSFCALGDGATSPITSSIKYFRDEYIAHVTNGACPFDPIASTLFEGADA